MGDREDFINNKMEDLDNMGLPDECVAMVRDVVVELAESADFVDALRATIASLTIQRDAAEALAREAKRDLDAVVDVLASERDEALAILRAFVAAEDTQMVKAKGSGAAHLGFGMYSDAMDRARKLVGTP